MSFELDYFCNSFNFKVDMFASCEQVKGNVLMRQKQRIFQMVGYNLKKEVSGSSWFAKNIYDLKPLQCFLVTEKINGAYCFYAPYVKWPD